MNSTIAIRLVAVVILIVVIMLACWWVWYMNKPMRPETCSLCGGDCLIHYEEGKGAHIAQGVPYDVAHKVLGDDVSGYQLTTQ